MAPEENIARCFSVPERRFNKTPHLTESLCHLLLFLGPFPEFISLPSWLTNFLDLIGSRFCPAKKLPSYIVSTLHIFSSPSHHPDKSTLATLWDNSAPSLEFAGCSLLELPLAPGDSCFLQP